MVVVVWPEQGLTLNLAPDAHRGRVQTWALDFNFPPNLHLTRPNFRVFFLLQPQQGFMVDQLPWIREDNARFS